MTPQVSVLIASYNHAEFVGIAIQSVLDQSFENIELIVVDDGSTDRSLEVIKGFSDPRISVEAFDHNRGLSAALNAGILRSRGRFLTVLGSDDFYLHSTLETQLRYLNSREQIAAVFGMPRLVDEAGNRIAGGYHEFTLPFGSAIPGRNDWLRHFFLFGNCLCHPTVMLRREVHDKIGLYDRRLLGMQDLDLWVRMLVASLQFDVVMDEFTARRVFPDARNLSGPRPATHRRAQFEYFRILHHYRRLPVATLRAAFAAEIADRPIVNTESVGMLLAEIAASSMRPMTQWFALDTMFDALGEQSDADCHRLFELSAALDPFRIAPDSPKATPKPPGAAPNARSQVAKNRGSRLVGGATNVGTTTTPRNAPCPCGSGRKFKYCHGRLAG